MTEACLTPPEGTARARRDALAAALPVLETDRLILRAPRLEDWPALAPIWTTDRASHIGGPMSAEEAWLDFTQIVAGWLLRGHGGLTITARADGKVLGLVLLGFEWGDPEAELGWLLTEAAEGHGYATEAARALRDWGQDLLGPDGFVSYISTGHDASAAVARRLGATLSGTHPASDEVEVYRFAEART